MDQDTFFFWFSFKEEGECLSDIQIEHGDIYSRLTYLLLSSLNSHPDDHHIRERIELELGFAVVQAWNQLIRKNLDAADTDLQLRLDTLPRAALNPIHSLKAHQLFAYPFQTESTLQRDIHLLSILWLLSRPQFTELQKHHIPEALRQDLQKSDFYGQFEQFISQTVLADAFTFYSESDSLQTLAQKMPQAYTLSTPLKNLLYRSLDRLAEINRQRHPTHSELETHPPWPASALDSSHADHIADRESSPLEEAFQGLRGSMAAGRTAPRWGKELIIVAKLLPVWLHQLSLKYARSITTLDQIPDQELKDLRELKITGLWLVGVWKRSDASKLIKGSGGNTAALASAYSIFDYEIDPSLGGSDALRVLSEKAGRHGIHLGADVIPNHTAIDSKWISEHPEWYISSDTPPYPSYTFHKPNLSREAHLDIRIEDHYYDHSDAAVVFRYHNRHKMDRPLYVYHGNDGTHVPWNDTAQLDYLNPDLRKKMIETIIDVSRQFPLIRLDAAMTLTRQHYKRLWFPPPGEGGAIPSRSGCMPSQEEFDRRYGPLEFWQEALIALNKANPDALLLAEAFWLMEPYFINHIGMHKVYHSAFMNILRDYFGHRFREYIATLLDQHPLDTLNHFVNFLSTPDEAPAAIAFGKGDRFMAASVLLATFPGTPLFSHNQWEGLEEQYGMEFASPMNNIPGDHGFNEFSRSMLLPLLERRDIFSHAENFRMIGFKSNTDERSENVIAYVNSVSGMTAFVLVNYQDVSLTGYCQAPDAAVNGTSQIDYLTCSHNAKVVDSPFSQITLGPWGFCVFSIAQK